jgi:hypothetical protein
MPMAAPIRGSVWGKLLVPATVVALLFCATGPVGDPDLGWHMVHGEHFLRTFERPTHAVFSSMPADPPMMSNDWLGGLVYALAYRGLGFAGIVWVRLAAVAAVCLLLVLAARRAGLSRGPTALFLLLVVVPCSFRLFVERPFLIAYPCLLFFALLAPRAAFSWRLVAALVALQGVWTQIHGCAVLGPLIAGAVLVGVLLGRIRPALFHVATPGDGAAAPLAPALILFLSSGAALFSGPLGRGTPRLFHGVASDLVQLAQVTPEWSRPTLDLLVHQLPVVGIGLLVLACLVVGGEALRRGSRPAPALLMVLGTGLLATRSVRFLPEAILVASPLVAGAIGVLASRLGEKRSAAIVGALALPVLVSFAVRLATDGVERPAFRARRAWYPAAAARSLAQAPPGVVGNTLEFGGFLLHELGPRVRPYVDGRIIVAYPISRLLEQGAALASPAQLDAFARKEGLVGFVLAYPDAAACRAFDAASWALVQLDDVSVTFLRRDLADPGWLAAHELTSLDPRNPFQSIAKAVAAGQVTAIEADLGRAEALTGDRFLLLALRARLAALTGDPRAASLREQALAAFPGRESLRFAQVEPQQVLDAL